MKFHAYCAIAFLAVFSSFFISHSAFAEAKSRAAAPEFSATDSLSGKLISLSNFKGKLVVLEWTNPQCPFVHKFYSVGAMQQLQQNATKKGVVWISINSSAKGKEGFLKTDADAATWHSEQKAKSTYYVRDTNGSIGKLYGAKTTPHMFVIDAGGMIAYAGAMDDKPTADTADIATAQNYVTTALASLTEGKPVTTAQTKPYGCSVKY